MKAQYEFTQKLVERLELIEQRQIERDQQLMKAIRETQQAKKELTHINKNKKVLGVLEMNKRKRKCRR